MRTEYQYAVEIFDLGDDTSDIVKADLIKNVLNKKGREGYAIVSVNEFGGYGISKRIMYTLSREKTEYNPFEEPEFYKTKPGFIPPTGEAQTISSRLNSLSLPPSDDKEPDF